MTYSTFSSFDSEEDVLLAESTTVNQQELIVYNDDYNTFEWVINCFVEILKHTFEQAEQLSYIIHFTGKASVKIGSYYTLKPLKEALIDKGLSVVIE
ncbi:MAG: ATP-dependent Clp protease adaptor ClpS [Saprospiraceae bacterium]|nr:ATP-dependent Clp protease adaptor ClpS [Saprospiraceae bacterium]